MRILHVGIPNYSLSNSFIKFGEYEFIDWTDWTSIPENTKSLRAHTINKSLAFKPDIIFFQLQNPEPYDGYSLSQMPGFKVNWTWDCRQPLPHWFSDVATGANLTCFTNEHDVKQMKDLGYKSEFLQSGFDNEVFTMDGIIEDTCPDIVFMGNNYDYETYQFPLTPFRVEMVNFLRDKYGSNFAVFGHGWDFRTEALVHRERREAMMYRSCKIAISVSHYELERYTSDRIFRLLGSGAFCLCKWYPGVEKDFVDGIHLRTWNTLEELDALIKYYMEHEEERNMIATNGSKYVHDCYTWDIMIKRTIEFSKIYKV